MSRPSCIVRVRELPGEKRPRFTPGGGRVGAEVRAVGNASGLERMGVWHRTIPPGKAGTHRHFHLVEEEWAFVLAGEGAVRIGPHRIPVREGSFAAVDFRHDVDPEARRAMRPLSAAAGGLERQAVTWARVAAGASSTAHHTHERTDEWVLALAGRASLRVGDEWFELEAGDFVGHPAGGPPHQMRPLEDLVYLMGGMRDPDDVVLYPDAGQRRVGGRLEPLR